MRTAAHIKARYKRYLQRSGKVERVQVSADGGLNDPWRTISVSIAVDQRTEGDEHDESHALEITVWHFRDQADADVGGIAVLTRDYQLKRDPTFDANQTPFQFTGEIREEGRDYRVGVFRRTTTSYLGGAVE